MKKIYWLLSLALLAMACQNLQMGSGDDNIDPEFKYSTNELGNTALSVSNISCYETQTFPLLVNGSQAGTVSISVDESNVTLTYNLMTTQWFLLGVGAFAGDCNAIPGYLDFPNTRSFTTDDEVRFHTLTIPIASLPSCGCISSFAKVARYNPVSSQVESFLAFAEAPYCKCEGPEEPADTVNCVGNKVVPISAIGNEVGAVTITVNETSVNLTYDLSQNEWFLLEVEGAAGACNGTSAPTGATYTQSFVESDEIRQHSFSLSLTNLPDCGCVATSATLARYNSQTSQIETYEFSTSALYCTCRETEEPDDKNLRTQTPGGWGAPPRGSNPGAYLYANFQSAFPSGLTVGCNYTIRLTSAEAITNFLPQGGTPASLTKNYVDPINKSKGPDNPKNVLSSHVVALKLSVTFDLWDEDFGESNTNLANAVVTQGQFEGWTVGAILAEGEKVLGGCSSPYSASELNEVLSAINESNVDGTSSNGFIKNQ
jgi:hypothetical protein